MQRKAYVEANLNYLRNKLKIINWAVIAGEDNLDPIQKYDLIFDERDLKIRGLL